MQINEVSGQVVDAAMKVHSVLGPGLLEGVYEACLAFELESRGHHVQVQLPMPVTYMGLRLDVGYRIDLLVDNMVIVELKSVAKIAPIHEAQLMTYLKLSGHKVGLLINFGVVHLRDGIKRIVNKL
jgi:GxxExxY protein